MGIKILISREVISLILATELLTVKRIGARLRGSNSMEMSQELKNLASPGLPKSIGLSNYKPGIFMTVTYWNNPR